MTDSFFKRRIKNPLLAQLRQGTSPEKLALSCIVGMAIGLFPIIGSTTLLCLIIAYALRLNQPATQAVNQLMYPLQIPLVLVFVRIGEKIIGAPPVPLAPAKLASEFSAGPAAFLREYGMAGLHGIMAWAVIVPILAIPLYYVLFASFKNIAKRSAAH